MDHTLVKATTIKIANKGYRKNNQQGWHPTHRDGAGQRNKKSVISADISMIYRISIGTDTILRTKSRLGKKSG